MSEGDIEVITPKKMKNTERESLFPHKRHVTDGGNRPEDDEDDNDVNDPYKTNTTTTSRFGIDYTKTNSSNSTDEIYGSYDISLNGSADYTVWSKCLPVSWIHALFPPNVPRTVQLLRRENLAVPACYLCVGILQGLVGPFTNVYPLFINASEAQQATISNIRTLPATLKLAFGFLSDNVPLLGYRRKSYMFVGWAVSSFSMLLLLTFSDLGRHYVDEDGTGQMKAVPNEGAPSIPFLSACLLLFGMGYWLADVMGDSIVAEKSKLEPEHSRGQLQSTCYACRFFGVMVAAPLSSVLYSTFGPQLVIKLMALAPMTMLPFIYNFWELKDIEIKSTRAQCLEIWKTVCSRAVWQPMGFIYLYNILQVGNAAWRQFLRTILGFTDAQLNTLLVIAHVMVYLGIMAYKYYFITWSWRSVYVMTTILNGFFSALQILLITGETFGLSPFLFALGDDVLADFISGIQFLPTTIMMVHLCPTGSEGASYAMFTTVNNSALQLSSAISTVMLGIWDVSKETMIKGDLSGMIKLSVLTTALQTSGLLFVRLLPRTKEDLKRLHEGQNSGSSIGGSIFLIIILGSLVYSITVSILNIISPGWMGGSRY